MTKEQFNHEMKKIASIDWRGAAAAAQVILCMRYIESLEAEVANLNDWLTAWKESFTLAQAEIAQLQADNRSLVEQMNAMAMKPNQAIIERHEYDHDNPETYPAKRGFYICESASGKIELFWSPLAQEWYITEVHDKVYNHFQINAYYTWVRAPKGVTNE